MDFLDEEDEDNSGRLFLLGISDIGIEAIYDMTAIQEDNEQYILDILTYPSGMAPKPKNTVNIERMQFRARFNMHRNYQIISIGLPYTSKEDLESSLDKHGIDAELRLVELIKERGFHIGF